MNLEHPRRLCYDITKVERMVRQMSRIYTLAELKNTLNPIFEQFGVKKAVLFGSYAKGLATPRRDVDLYVDSGLRGLAFFGLLDGIASALDVPVDLIDASQVDKGSLIEQEIGRSGVQIYGWQKCRSPEKILQHTVSIREDIPALRQEFPAALEELF